jgi:sterol desaturase/sphingolipid hydroxylase (fatty acid hydroxylase superfamily)
MALGLGTGLACIHAGLNPMVSAVAISFGAMPVVALLERLLPYRKDWNENDGDVGADVLHLTLHQILMPNLMKPIWAGVLVGVTATLADRFGSNLWPAGWPLLAQLFLMLLIAEFGRYWVHRWSHEWPWLWRLHAVHHSPNRLYWMNAGRVHTLEKVLFLIPEVVPFILLGTNIETLALYAIFNSVHGLLQHSNIYLKAGPLNYVFSLTELHRWHHSKVIQESNHNYGNNLILWDIVFGTWYLPRDREVGIIGLLNRGYPKTFGGQFAAPFRRRDISKPEGYVRDRA